MHLNINEMNKVRGLLLLKIADVIEEFDFGNDLREIEKGAVIAASFCHSTITMLASMKYPKNKIHVTALETPVIAHIQKLIDRIVAEAN